MNLLAKRFILKPSAILLLLFVFIHAIGWGIICFTPIFWGLKPVLLFVIFFNQTAVIKKHILLNRVGAIVGFGININQDEEWYLERHLRGGCRATIVYPIFVSSHLVIINFIVKDNKRIYPLLIARDSLSEDDFRQLKFILKTMV